MITAHGWVRVPTGTPRGQASPCSSDRQATGAAWSQRLGCPNVCVLLTVVIALPGFQALPLAFQTAGDANEGLLIFGMDMATLQQWTLIYLGLSSLAFVLVWLIGILRR